MLSEPEFMIQYERLVDAFSQYSKNPGRTAGVYYENLSHLTPENLHQVVTSAIKTCKRFPSIAELKEIASSLCPQDGPADSSYASEEAYFNKRMAICDAIMTAVNRLPEAELTHIENIANKLLRDNAPEWYTPDMKLRAFQGFCIMAFKQRYPDQTNQIYQQSQDNTYSKPFTPIPFQQPRQITTTIIRNNPLTPVLDVM